MVYNLALQYVQNVQDAEEITQDVFLKVYNKIAGFENNADIKTWIYKITINSSLDYIKARKTAKRWSFFRALSLNNEEYKIDVPHFDHPGVILEHKEDTELLFKGINELPDNQKTVIILLKIEQKSQAETAEIMNTTSKAVEGLYQRAKKNLEIYLMQNKG
jgi:RNA polymerase sigma factor (sigma-70 family)